MFSNVENAKDDALKKQHLNVLLSLLLEAMNHVPMFNAPKLVEVVLREYEKGRTNTIKEIYYYYYCTFKHKKVSSSLSTKW